MSCARPSCPRRPRTAGSCSPSSSCGSWPRPRTRSAFWRRATIGAVAPALAVFVWASTLGTDALATRTTAGFLVAALLFLLVQHQSLVGRGRTSFSGRRVRAGTTVMTLGALAGAVAVVGALVVGPRSRARTPIHSSTYVASGRATAATASSPHSPASARISSGAAGSRCSRCAHRARTTGASRRWTGTRARTAVSGRSPPRATMRCRTGSTRPSTAPCCARSSTSPASPTDGSLPRTSRCRSKEATTRSS